MSFAGLKVVSFESRRASEMADLIVRSGGEVFTAPSMREVPIENNPEAFAFAERLDAGAFDSVVFLTGVGTRALTRAIETRYPAGWFAEALRRVAVYARGPKPAAVLREMKVPIAAIAPEPNTWHELLAAVEGRALGRTAVQEYGKPNPELVAGLRRLGAEVTTVRVYQWDLPEDLEPLREAARHIAHGEAGVALFTTSIQIAHLLHVAAQQGIEADTLRGLRSMVVASIGPTTTEALEEHGLVPDVTPSHPKMAFLVRETAAAAAAILSSKRDNARAQGH